MRIHYNKYKKKIVVHHSNQCHLVNLVEIKMPCRIVNYPDKKSNPRSWIDVKGKLTIIRRGSDGEVAIITKDRHILGKHIIFPTDINTLMGRHKKRKR